LRSERSPKVELELGPIGRLREGSKRFLVAPAVIANIGFSGDRELVIEGQREIAVDCEAGEPHSALVDDGAGWSVAGHLEPQVPRTFADN